MPAFSSPWENANDPQMDISKEQLLSALRFALAAELEAISVYKQIANKTNIMRIRENLMSLAKEEEVHVGELLRLIAELDGEEFKNYQKGISEANDVLKNSVGVFDE